MFILNEDEKNIIRAVLKYSGLWLNSGSYEIRSDKKVRYYLNIGMRSNATIGKSIAKRLKKALNAAEIYQMGTRIA